MVWHRIVYGLLCLIVPVAWGLLVYAASTAIERRVLRAKSSAIDPPADHGGDPLTLPLDYHI